VGDAGDGVSMANGQDQGKAGLGGSGRGPREKERERDRASVGHQHAGPGGTAPGDVVQTGFETKI
jgi:hypothetical protein